MLLLKDRSNEVALRTSQDVAAMIDCSKGRDY